MVGLTEKGDKAPKVRLLGHSWPDPGCTLSPQGCQAAGAARGHSPARSRAGGLPAGLLRSADLSVGEQRGRRATKVSRVFSVSPAFHKLLVVAGAGTQLGCPLPRPASQLHPSPASQIPRVFPAPSVLAGEPSPTLASCPPTPQVPSLDGLQLAEGRQAFRENAQDPFLNLPTCGRGRSKGSQTSGRGGVWRGR